MTLFIRENTIIDAAGQSIAATFKRGSREGVDAALEPSLGHDDDGHERLQKEIATCQYL